MLKPKEALRALIDKQLGGPGITQAQRWQDALQARKCRNLFFNATAPAVNLTAVGVPADVVVQAQTQPYGTPLIITDILNFTEPYVVGFYPGVIWQLAKVLTSGAGLQEDFFGAGSLLCSLFTLGHYQCDPRQNRDAPTIKQHFMPYIMRPGEIFQFTWELMDAGSLGSTDAVNPEALIRAVRVFGPGEVEGDLCGKAKDQVCDYIKRWDTETFILDVRIPLGDFPAAGASIIVNTELQERPLLIYGIGTNIVGAQITMRDDGLRWEFCARPTPPRSVISGGAPVAGNYGNIQGLPITAVAGNGDATINEAYNMLPVPHLLTPMTGLTIRLTNGLRPNGVTGVFQTTMVTTSNSLHSTGDGHISFLCRTV